MIDPTYVIDDARGDGWNLMLGDSCERLAEVKDDSVDLAIYSPPFASLFVYSPSMRDLGNSKDRAEFLTHYGFIIREMLRVTRPGRINAVHVQQLTTTKSTHGVVGLTDFRGDVIRAYLAAGWIFHGEVTVDKDPQAQAIRTKAQALMFVQKNKDSAKSRPALADYLLLFRKPGDIETPVKTDITNDEWIKWARPIWRAPDTLGEDIRTLLAAARVIEDHAGSGSLLSGNIRELVKLISGEAVDYAPEIVVEPMRDEHGLVVPRSCWYGIRESNTLNVAAGRDSQDERHICPLQLDLIEVAVRLWSNPGETVCSPFAGIGSEGYVAVQQGREFVGIELKPSYWKAAVANLKRAERAVGALTLFDTLDA